MTVPILKGYKNPNVDSHGKRPEYVYVASSWRNPLQPAVIQVLKAAGIDCYDFREPTPGASGFHWSEVMPSYRRSGPGMPEQLALSHEYLECLKHPVSEQGFANDYNAMVRADTGVCVLPCGKSAHDEIGWMAGQGKRTAILLDGDSVTPELMYKLHDYIAPNIHDLLGWLGVQD